MMWVRASVLELPRDAKHPCARVATAITITAVFRVDVWVGVGMVMAEPLTPLRLRPDESVQPARLHRRLLHRRLAHRLLALLSEGRGRARGDPRLVDITMELREHVGHSYG